MLLSTVVILFVLIVLLVNITAEKPHNVLAMCIVFDAQKKSKEISEL